MRGNDGMRNSQQMIQSSGSVQIVGNDNTVISLKVPPLPPTPYEIKRIASRLVDRSSERDTITKHASSSDALPILNVYGDAGLGKRAVVHDWAYEHRSEFPGGQIRIDVSGVGSSRRTPTFDTLRFVLCRLASPYLVKEMPMEALADLYSSLTAGERMMVVVEGASSYSQVKPFIPQRDDSLVVVTSERPIEDDFTFRPVKLVEVAPLGDDVAGELVSEVLEELGAMDLATRETVDRIVEMSQGVPQRLVTNARLLGQGGYTKSRRMSYGSRPGPYVRRGALIPLAELSQEESERVAVLEAVGGTSLTLPLIASVWRTSLDEARSTLERMSEFGLVRVDGTSACCVRYSVDPETRAMLIVRTSGQAMRMVGVWEALRYYRELMQEVNTALSTHRLRTYGRVRVRDMVVGHLAGYSPLALFEAEKDCMMAVVERASAASVRCSWWEIGEAAWPAFRAAGYSQAGAHMLSLCADACPDDTAEGRLTKARLHSQAAHCYCDVGDLAAARGRIELALALVEGLAHSRVADRVRASVHEFNGTILREEGAYDAAEAEYHLALDAARRIGRSRSESIQLYLLGRVKLRRGDFVEALTYLNRALALAATDDRPMRANILACRAKARMDIREYDPCVRDASQAARLYDELHAPWRLAGVLETLASAYELLGKRGAAREAREAARTVSVGVRITEA